MPWPECSQQAARHESDPSTRLIGPNRLAATKIATYDVFKRDYLAANSNLAGEQRALTADHGVARTKISNKQGQEN